MTILCRVSYVHELGSLIRGYPIQYYFHYKRIRRAKFPIADEVFFSFFFKYSFIVVYFLYFCGDKSTTNFATTYVNLGLGLSKYRTTHANSTRTPQINDDCFSNGRSFCNFPRTQVRVALVNALNLVHANH